MSDKSSHEAGVPEASNPVIGRRLFLQSMGKWSGAAIVAAVAGSWLASPPSVEAGSWINRRGGGGGSWVNRFGGGGGGWINRGGGWGNFGGGWINRVGGWNNFGGGWINHGGPGGWINRW